MRPAPASRTSAIAISSMTKTPCARCFRARCTAATFFECLLQIRTRNLQRGRETKENSGEQRDQKREREHAIIEANFAGARQGAGHNGERRAYTPIRQRESQASADDSEENAFGEQLPNETAGARARRGTYCYFTCAAAGPREQQVGHIYAGDEQNERHGS